MIGAKRLEPDTERIMELTLPDGTALSSSLVIYPYRGAWAIPLGQFADILGIAVTVWSKNRVAEGFIIDETRKFRVDAEKCEASVEGVRTPFRCEELVEKDDDFYVQDSLLARWFPVDILVSSLGSQVTVTPRELLPAEARRKRERDSERLRPVEEQDPGYPRLDVPYGSLGFHSLDQQISLTSDTSTGVGRILNGNSFLSGEVAGMETSLLANYTEKELVGWRFTAMRRSPDGDLWGAAKLSQVALFDVDVPTVPLVAETLPVRGLLLSSYQLNDPLNWENTDLQGPLPGGWEVLLFRNEVFTDRRVADGSGWYRFNNVPLQYGRNLLKLVFFGPHGERREQYRTILIDRSQQKAGRRDYRLGMGFKPSNGKPALSFQISESLARSLTGLGGFFYENDTGRRFATLGLVGLTDFALGTARLAYSLDGGYAGELGVQTGLGPVAVGAKFTSLDRFRSQLFNPGDGPLQTEQWEANAFYLIPAGLNLVWNSELTRRKFETGAADTLWRNRFTTNIGTVQVQSQLDWTPESPRHFFGRSEVFYFPYAFRVRAAAEYDFERLTAVETEGQWVQPDRYQLTANVRWPFDGNSIRVLLQASRLFREVSLGAFVNAIVGGRATAGLFAAFSLVREPRTGDFTLVRNAQSFNGAVSLFAFEDANHNGIADPNERGVAGLEFQTCSRDPVKTEANGIVHVSGIRAQFPCDIKAMENPEGDPFLRPVRPGYRIIPRAGLSARVDFPFHRVGQVDGFVRVGKGKATRGKRNVELELVGMDGQVVASARTDAEGFYAFEEILAGFEYRVRPKADWVARSGQAVTPMERHVAVSAAGAFVSGQDFQIVEEREPSAVKKRKKPAKRR